MQVSVYIIHILKFVRKCLVMEYVYVIKLLVVMLVDTNVVTNVICS